jgi:hypothetical protein
MTRMPRSPSAATVQQQQRQQRLRPAVPSAVVALQAALAAYHIQLPKTLALKRFPPQPRYFVILSSWQQASSLVMSQNEDSIGSRRLRDEGNPINVSLRCCC